MATWWRRRLTKCCLRGRPTGDLPSGILPGVESPLALEQESRELRAGLAELGVEPVQEARVGREGAPPPGLLKQPDRLVHLAGAEVAATPLQRVGRLPQRFGVAGFPGRPQDREARRGVLEEQVRELGEDVRLPVFLQIRELVEDRGVEGGVVLPLARGLPGVPSIRG